MMDAVVTTGAIRRAKFQSNHHHQQTPSFFTDRMVFLSPNQQRQCIEGTDVKIFLVVVLVIIFLLMASFHRSLLFRFLHFNAVGYSLP